MRPMYVWLCAMSDAMSSAFLFLGTNTMNKIRHFLPCLRETSHVPGAFSFFGWSLACRRVLDLSWW